MCKVFHIKTNKGTSPSVNYLTSHCNQNYVCVVLEKYLTDTFSFTCSYSRWRDEEKVGGWKHISQDISKTIGSRKVVQLSKLVVFKQGIHLRK